MMWLSGVRSSCLRLGFKWGLDLPMKDHKNPSQGYHVKNRPRIQANYPIMTRWAATESERKAAYSEDPHDVRFLRQREREECGSKSRKRGIGVGWGGRRYDPDRRRFCVVCDSCGKGVKAVFAAWNCPLLSRQPSTRRTRVTRFGSPSSRVCGSGMRRLSRQCSSGVRERALRTIVGMFLY